MHSIEFISGNKQIICDVHLLWPRTLNNLMQFQMLKLKKQFNI